MPTPVPLSRDARDNFFVGALYYNGVNFPPIHKCKCTFEPVYDDSGRARKYVKGTLSVEAILYPGCLDTPVSNAIPYREALYVESTLESGYDKTTDTTLATIRANLSEPCQHLIFHYQGGGHINLNDPGSEASPTNYTGPSSKAFDVNNGPKPTLVKWSPMTNKAALVVWEVEFCFSPCQNESTGKFPSGNRVTQFPFTVTLDIDEKGLTTRNVSGVYEIAITRYPTLTTHPGASHSFDMNELCTDILSVFPRLLNFKRTREHFTLSSDRTKIEFIITDEEIGSPDCYGTGIANEDVRISTSSSLDRGFSVWSTTMEGKLDLMAGFGKDWGWAEITRLYKKFAATFVKGNPGLGVDKLKISDENKSKIRALSSSAAILRSVRFTDDLFDRSISFSYTWDLFVDFDTFLLATGLFKPVEDRPEDRKKRWNSWILSSSGVYDTAGYQELTFNQNQDILVNLCGTWYGPKPNRLVKPVTPGVAPPKEKGLEDGQTSIEGYSTQDEAKLYSLYENAFYISAIQGATFHSPLYALPVVTDELEKATPTQNKKAVTFPAQTGSPDVITHHFRPTTYVLTMVGRAIRLGYPVDIPAVVSYGGRSLTKFGVDDIRPVRLGRGLNLVDNNDYSIHGAYWKKQYILPNYPMNSTYETDGYPTSYIG